MESKLSVNNLSVEDLLKSLDKNDSENITYTNDVLNFVSVFQIKEGTHKVKGKLLYKLYRIWSKKPLKQVQFVTELQLFINWDVSVFYTNIDSLKLRLLVDKLRPKIKFEKVKSKTVRKSFEKFLSAVGLKPGDYWLEDYILFYAFRVYCFENKKKVTYNAKNFEMMCRIYFKAKPTRELCYFKVDKSFKYVTKESIENLRNAKKDKKK